MEGDVPLRLVRVQEERLLRTVHALAEKQLLGKAFQVLRKLITREAAAEAQLHLRKTQLMFEVFDRWKKHCKRKQALQELSLSLAEGLQLKWKMEAVERLCRYKSQAERSFVQDRIVTRFRHQHLLELFYPFKRVITHLVDIRVASIKLSSYLATSRSRQALRRLGTHAQRTFQLLRSYRQYKERETLRRLLEKWLRLSQTYFVQRKQYELSVLFHKTRLERKVLNLMTEKTAGGRPLRHTTKILEKWLKRSRCAYTFRVMSQTVHETAQPKQAAAVLRLELLGSQLRLFRAGCLQERQRKQRSWHTRRLAAYLKKKLQMCRRSAGVHLFVVHSRHSMSQSQLNSLAEGYFRRRVMLACWQTLLPD